MDGVQHRVQIALPAGGVALVELLQKDAGVEQELAHIGVPHGKREGPQFSHLALARGKSFDRERACDGRRVGQAQGCIHQPGGHAEVLP
ncbi:hypothetical protein D3C75_911830 [compost metagenome]